MMTMRVLVKVNSLELGGTQLNALDFAQAMERHSVTSVLVGYRETLPARAPSLLDVATERGVRIELLDKGAGPGDGGSWGTRVRRAREMAALADQHAIDLVHSYSDSEARISYWGPCLLGRRPHVITAYEMAISRRVHHFPPLVVGTQYLLEDLAGRSGKVHLISPPVALDRDQTDTVAGRAFLTSLQLAEDHVRIVIVSRLSEDMKARGIELAVQGMQTLGAENVDLVVVGAGEAESRLRLLADTVNARLGRRAVVFTGAISDPRPAYSAADIVVGMGGSAARALAFSKPLIVTGDSGWFQTFTPDTAAMLFRNSFWSDATLSDPTAMLISLVRDLAAQPNKRAELGAFGRRFAANNFGLDAMAARLAEIYREALEERHVRAKWIADLRVEAATITRQLRGGSA